MRYFLDTNMILIPFQGRFDEMSKEVEKVLKDEKNTFVASVISLNEIIQLYRKKKIANIDYQKYDTPYKLLRSIIYHFKNSSGIEFLTFDTACAFRVSRINFVPKHNDPNDLAIIAHSIVEKATIISTDRLFKEYEKQGAKVIYNKR